VRLNIWCAISVGGGGAQERRSSERSSLSEWNVGMNWRLLTHTGFIERKDLRNLTMNLLLHCLGPLICAFLPRLVLPFLSGYFSCKLFVTSFTVE
jgi:hypothetical protein